MEDRFFVLSRNCGEAYSDEEGPSDCRLLLSRFNTPHMSSFEIEVLGHNLFLSQDPNSKHLGTTVWDSSLVFAKFMERNSKKGEFSRAKISGKRVIELGAGCGLAGLSMALLGCNVVVTDQVAVLPILLRNVERNLARAKYTASDNAYIGSIGNVEVAELDWGDEPHIAAVEPPFDYIIGTDVVYVEHLLEPLVKTILLLAGPKTTVLLGYEFRSSGVREQLHELCKKHFHVKKVLHSKMDPKYQHPNIDLFILRRIDTSTNSPFIGSSEGLCYPEEEAETSYAGQSNGVTENGAENPKFSSMKEGITNGETSQEQNGDIPPATDNGILSDEENSSGTRSTQTGKSGLTLSKFSSVDNSSHEKSRSQLSDWELRRLGSSAARLLAPVSPPSCERH